MAAGSHNITLEQGADFSLSVTWLDSSGSPVSLAGCTAKMQARKSRSATDVLVELSTENGRITLTTTIDLALPASVTKTLAAGSYVYDLEVYSATKTTRILTGMLAVSGEVTR